MHLPAAPKWDKAVDGLDMKDFNRHAQEFERSLLPSGIVFPREGQVWRTTRNCGVGYMAWFSKAALGQPQPTFPHFFPCGWARLEKGEDVRVLALDDPRPLTITFVPVRYAELEAAIVPANLRAWSGYANYQLSAPTARTLGLEKMRDYFTECFVLVTDAA